MKNKKNIFLIIAIIIIIAVVLVFYFIKKNNSKTDTSDNILEYTPEEEISTEQMRETLITLYFIDTQTSELKTEGRLLDATLLIENPYKEIVQLLLDGPKTTTMQSVFPENTQIIDAKIENNCVTLNFSSELNNCVDDTQKYNIINSILNSLTQLNEVNSIKFLVNGEPSTLFNEEYVCLT